MRQVINKTQLKQALVAERKRMREQQKQSLFMRRTLSIYNGQKIRAAGLKLKVEYSLEDFREWFTAVIKIGLCDYCGGPVRIRTLVPEHRLPVARGGGFTLKNTAAACKPCNWQKGLMDDEEFVRFQEFLHTLGDLTVTDIRRRLSLGGKWVGKL